MAARVNASAVHSRKSHNLVCAFVYVSIYAIISKFLITYFTRLQSGLLGEDCSVHEVHRFRLNLAQAEIRVPYIGHSVPKQPCLRRTGCTN